MITDDGARYVESSVLCWLATVSEDGVPTINRRAAVTALALILCSGIPADAQEETGAGLPFQAKVKKEAFEKKVQQGTARILEQYQASLLAITKRRFTAASAEGLESVRKEQERFGKYRDELEKSTPLDFIASRFRRLNRDEVELETHLAESVWKLTDGRMLKLLNGGALAFDGKRDSDYGWEVADANHFVWGGRFWKTEVRDKHRRFDATTWTGRKETRQGVFVDSVEYNGGPVRLMVQESGKAKLKLAAGLKPLITAYATDLREIKKAQLNEENLQGANAVQTEWERLFEATDRLFGTEVNLGQPSEAIRPFFQTAEQLRTGLTGTVWRFKNGDALGLRRGGKAVIRPFSPLPYVTGWEVLDHRTVVFGANYFRVRFDPGLTVFSGKSRIRPLEKSAKVEEGPKR